MIRAVWFSPQGCPGAAVTFQDALCPWTTLGARCPQYLRWQLVLGPGTTMGSHGQVLAALPSEDGGIEVDVDRIRRVVVPHQHRLAAPLVPDSLLDSNGVIQPDALGSAGHPDSTLDVYFGTPMWCRGLKTRKSSKPPAPSTVSGEGAGGGCRVRFGQLSEHTE